MTLILPLKPVLPIYWGVSESSTLDEAGVLALENTLDASYATGRAYEFGDPAGGYCYIAIPAAFGEWETMKRNGLNFSLEKASMAVSVNDESVDYVVYAAGQIDSDEFTLEPK